MDDNILNQKWSAGSLLRFAFATIVMMIFMGLYTMVDTIIATGGNAIVSRKMGAGENQEAKEAFTLLIITGATIGFLILLGGTIWVDKIVYALGANDIIFPYCKDYLMVLFFFIPANVLHTLFSNLFVTAGKPGLGFGLSVLAGVANIILDYIFIVLWGLGIQGAALGTGFGFLIPAAAGLVYFAGRKEGLDFTRPKLKWAVIGESCFNGSSEMVGQLATAVTTFLFNHKMMNMLGENGVADDISEVYGIEANGFTIFSYSFLFCSLTILPPRGCPEFCNSAKIRNKRLSPFQNQNSHLSPCREASADNRSCPILLFIPGLLAG